MCNYFYGVLRRKWPWCYDQEWFGDGLVQEMLFKLRLRAGVVAQWQNACLVCTRW
jgi:hypothetical protein